MPRAKEGEIPEIGFWPLVRETAFLVVAFGLEANVLKEVSA